MVIDMDDDERAAIIAESRTILERLSDIKATSRDPLREEVLERGSVNGLSDMSDNCRPVDAGQAAESLSNCARTIGRPSLNGRIDAAFAKHDAVKVGSNRPGAR